MRFIFDKVRDRRLIIVRFGVKVNLDWLFCWIENLSDGRNICFYYNEYNWIVFDLFFMIKIWIGYMIEEILFGCNGMVVDMNDLSE